MMHTNQKANRKIKTHKNQHTKKRKKNSRPIRNYYMKIMSLKQYTRVRSRPSINAKLI